MSAGLSRLGSAVLRLRAEFEELGITDLAIRLEQRDLEILKMMAREDHGGPAAGVVDPPYSSAVTTICGVRIITEDDL